MKLWLDDLRPALAFADPPPRLPRRLDLHRQSEGAQLSSVLTAAGLSRRRATSFFCRRHLEETRSTRPAASTRRSISSTPFHPTILAYETNYAALKVEVEQWRTLRLRSNASLATDGQIHHAHRGDR
jgi:hypothetical protein